jgi:hypothetical protein
MEGSSNMRMRTGVVLVLVAALVVIAATGCATTTSTTTGSAPTSPMAKGNMPTGGMAMQAGNVQGCANCMTGKMAPKVLGTVLMKNGVQLIDVGLAKGYYAPNQFEAKAGIPITVTFSGEATGCLSKPQFPGLGMKGDMKPSGKATFDLGALKPGVYKFTCGMGMNSGDITVK